MFHHILTIIYRNFKRFRSTFLINLIGLSTGLACAIVIYLWVADETRIDRFHEHGDRLFQVMTNQNRPDVIVTLGEGPGMLEDELPAAFPEIEYAVGSSGIGDFITLSTPNKNLQATGQFAGLHYFEIFSFPLLEGNPKDVLKDEKSIVLSQRMALALFDTDKDVVGKALEWKVPGYTEQVMVSGIFEDINPISCLGLFGLATFTAERRLKEIGIRKVLGSSVPRIIYLLTREFSDVVLVAVLIAAPISYFITSTWLNTFAFRVEVPWWNFLMAGLASLVLAWLTVGVQAWKAANVNPVQCLKDE